MQAALDAFERPRELTGTDDAATQWLLPAWSGLIDSAQRRMFLDAALLMHGCPVDHLQVSLATRHVPLLQSDVVFVVPCKTAGHA